MIITKDELIKAKKAYVESLKSKVFIYPTDSIYGLGCDATKEELVEKVRNIKKSTIQPFSVIAPSKEWVYENCVVGEREKKYVEMLGKKIMLNDEEHCFTIVLKLKNKSAIAKNVSQGLNTIGIRIPEHWFSKVVEAMNTPVVTTSANPTGEDFMTSIEDLNENVRKQADFIIYEGEKKGHPSTIIHAEKGLKEVKVR